MEAVEESRRRVSIKRVSVEAFQLKVSDEGSKSKF